MKKFFLILFFLLIKEVYAQKTFDAYYFQIPSALSTSLLARYKFPVVRLAHTQSITSHIFRPQRSFFQYSMTFDKYSMGFSANFSQNKYGSVISNMAGFGYFYYIVLNTKGDFMSFGTKVSLEQKRFSIPDTLSFDPALVSNGGYQNSYKPIFSADFYYQDDKLMFSTGIDNIYPIKNKNYSPNLEPRPKRSYFLFSEIRLDLSNNFILQPSFYFYIDEKFYREVQLGFKTIVNYWFLFGLFYSDALNSFAAAKHNLSSLIGIKLFERFTLIYCTDINLTWANRAYGLAHSVALNIDFFGRRYYGRIYFP